MPIKVTNSELGIRVDGKEDEAGKKIEEVFSSNSRSHVGMEVVERPRYSLGSAGSHPFFFSAAYAGY